MVNLAVHKDWHLARGTDENSDIYEDFNSINQNCKPQTLSEYEAKIIPLKHYRTKKITVSYSFHKV